MEAISKENLKPLAYLDHNILDYLVKCNDEPHNGEPLRTDLIDNHQVFFSDENLNEIERSVEYEQKFLRTLESLHPLCLRRIDGDNPSFEAISPVVLFDRLKSLPPLVRDFEQSMNEVSLKLNAGEGEENVFEKSVDAFTALIQNFKAQAEHYGLTAFFNEFCDDYFDRLRDKYIEELRMYVEYYERVVKEEQKYLAPIDRREMFRVSARELNNIESPHVVLKIWELIKKRNNLGGQNISLNRILGLETNLFAPGKPLSLFQKVILVYHFLNWIGYYTDSNLKKPKRFYASRSDQIHGAYGIFGQRIFSMDERFVRKLDATYEYLGIKTEVVLVKSMYLLEKSPL